MPGRNRRYSQTQRRKSSSSPFSQHYTICSSAQESTSSDATIFDRQQHRQLEFRSIDKNTIHGKQLISSCSFCQSQRTAPLLHHTALAFDDEVCLKHFGQDGHPECPERLQCVLDLLRQNHFCCRFRRIPVSVALFREAYQEEVHLCHPESHLKHITCLTKASSLSSQTCSQAEYYCRKSGERTISFGGDSYYCSSTASAALTSLGTTLSLIDQMMDPESPITTGFALVRPPGHHACSQKVMGFCYFNNVAVAAKKLRHHYNVSKVLIVDFDVHHGNGTQEIFEKDPHCLFFSVRLKELRVTLYSTQYIQVHRHDDGKFYPLTGGKNEIGNAAGKGFSINVPLGKGYGNIDFYIVVRDVLMPAALAFHPEVILVSAGFDAVAGDPLGQCGMTPECFGWVTRQLLRLARHLTRSRIAFVLEGGYNPVLLRNCVEQCLNQMALLDNQLEDYQDNRMFIERLRSVETMGVPNFETLIVPSPQDHFDNYYCQQQAVPATATSWLSSLDYRYDLLSQLFHWGYQQGFRTSEDWKQILSIPLPYVVCPKLTWKTIQEVYDIHADGLLALSPPLPLVTRIRKKNRSFTSDEPLSTNGTDSSWPEEPTVSNDNLQYHNASCTKNIVTTDEQFQSVGGHEDQWKIFSNTKQGFICKITGPIEAMFYIWLATSIGNKDLPLLRFISSTIGVSGSLLSPSSSSSSSSVQQSNEVNAPGLFFETLPLPTIEIEEAKKLMSFVPDCQAIDIPLNHSPSLCGLGNRLYHVEMKNLIYGYRYPCVMDLKLGIRMYGDDASTEKKERMILKAKNSTSARYGVRFTAARAWDASTQSIVETTRAEAATFRELEQLESAIFVYLNAAPIPQRIPVARTFRSRLVELYNWFKVQVVAHFYSSSLLFFYDNALSNISSTSDIKMIDFAHVTFNANCPDSGYTFGLQTLIKIFDSFLSNCQE